MQHPPSHLISAHGPIDRSDACTMMATLGSPKSTSQQRDDVRQALVMSCAPLFVRLGGEVLTVKVAATGLSGADLFHASVEKSLQIINRYNPEIASLPTYLWHPVRNHLVGLARTAVRNHGCDDPVGVGESEHLADDWGSGFDDVESRLQFRWQMSVLGKVLTARELSVFRHRFLESDTPVPRRRVAATLDLSTQQTVEAERRALAKLRHPCCDGLGGPGGFERSFTAD